MSDPRTMSEQGTAALNARQSKGPALAAAFRIITTELRMVCARLNILVELDKARRHWRSQLQLRSSRQGAWDPVRCLGAIMMAVVQHTRRTGDPLGFCSGLLDVHDVLASTLRLNRPLAESRGVVLVNDIGRPVAVDGDRLLLLDAADVLVSNAIRRCPPGGRVVCQAELREGMALVHIADDGDSLDEVSIARALRPFDSTSSDRLGDTGPLQLDLWFARLIAERHRGRIVAGTADGGCGNLFTLSLPAELH